ncbi:MAG: HAD family phosphatase [Lachnospiraceae bacterium]|jgi:HAD superfamily hydrolase (TIGR01509 family)|nr:HAD family phosphatase [Lachnospiraceae bacterium]MEE3460866.1 HAD family phosphatase [Lachnospiraceae bacterium]
MNLNDTKEMLESMKGAVFDMDGTLTDSMFLWDKASADYLLNQGIRPEPDIAKKFKTMSLHDSALYYQEKYGIKDPVEKIMKDVNDLTEKYYTTTVEAKPHVKEFLELIKASGIPMAVATSTDFYLVRKCLSHVGLLDYFETIVTCNMVGIGKTDPKVYLEALDRIGVNKTDAVIFEDSCFAITTLFNNNFNIVAIYDKSSDEDSEDIKRMSGRYIHDWSEML